MRARSAVLPTTLGLVAAGVALRVAALDVGWFGIDQARDVATALDVARGLEQRGHQVYRSAVPWGGGQAIWIDWQKGTLTGGSDPRKDGAAIGY